MALCSHNLKSFLLVVERGSFSKAAEELFITPNAIIKHVNALECDLGLTLLKRTHRGVKPTESGKFIYDEAVGLMAEADRIVAQAHEIEGKPSRKVRLGISMMRPSTEMMKLWNSVKDEHPSIELDFVTIADDINIWPKVYASLGNQIDVVVSPHPSEHQSWANSCIVKDLYLTNGLCMVPLGHPLATRSHIKLSDLNGMTLKTAPVGYASDSDKIRCFIEQNYPSIVLGDFHPYDFQNLNDLAHENAIVLCHEGMIGAHPSFVYIPIDEPLSITMCILAAKDCSDAVTEFVDAIAEAAAMPDLR